MKNPYNFETPVASEDNEQCQGNIWVLLKMWRAITIWIRIKPPIHNFLNIFNFSDKVLLLIVLIFFKGIVISRYTRKWLI